MTEQQMVLTDHVRAEFTRMAHDGMKHHRRDWAYYYGASGRETLDISVYDALMSRYRAWLVFGWKDVPLYIGRDRSKS